MKIRIIVTLMLFILSSCSEKPSYFHTRKIDDYLSLEIFKIEGGAYGSDHYYYYLTDFETFNKYVGKRDEKGSLKSTVDENGVYIMIYRDRQKKQLKDSTFYSFKSLGN